MALGDAASASRREDTVAVLAAAALDVDAVATRTANAWERLERMGADQHLVTATAAAVKALVEVAAALRRDGLLGAGARRR